MLGADVSSNLYLLTAFGAGVISFLSPCVLPIVPGYLSLVTGLSVGEIRDANLQAHYLRRIAFYTALFVAGFTVVFVLLGLVTTAVGERGVPQPGDPHPHLRRRRAADGVLPRGVTDCSPRRACTRSSAGTRTSNASARSRRRSPVRRSAWAGRRASGRCSARCSASRPRGRTWAPWSCCSSPTRRGWGSRSCVSGWPWASSTRALDWCKRHSRAITLVSAAILAVFGFILLTDQLSAVTAHMSNFLRDHGFGWIVDIG